MRYVKEPSCILLLLLLVGQIRCFDAEETSDEPFLFSYEESAINSVYGIGQLKPHFEALFPLYLPNPLDRKVVSEECRKDVLKIFTTLFGLPADIMNIKENKTNIIRDRWVLKLIDSWGKHEDGILQGSSDAMGYFDECLSVKTENNPEALETQYCILSYQPKPKNMSKSTRITRPRLNSKLGIPLVFNRYATCMPASCSKYELVHSINEELENSTVEVKHADCQIKDPEKDFDGSEIFGIIFFTLLGCLLVAGSILDIVTEQLNKKEMRTKFGWLLAFSIPTNTSKIFQLDTKPNPEMFTSVHGIRVLSMLWVMLAHLYGSSVGSATNKYAVRKYTYNFWEQLVYNGYHSVDTFFALGGFFLAHGVWKSLDKSNGKFPYVMYYVHRFIRLLPPLAIFTCFMATISNKFVHGPLAPSFEDSYVTGCRHSWWADVVFGSNFFVSYKMDDPEKQGEAPTCCAQCWYIANDMQIYIFMPIIVLPIFYLKKKGIYWLSIWTFISVLIPSLLIGIWELPPANLLSMFGDPSAMDYMDKVYNRPYCRFNAYMAGFIGAYILRQFPEKPKLSMFTVVFGWVFTFLLSFAIVYGLYPYNQFQIIDPKEISQAYSVIYGGFTGLLWGGCVCWVVLACYWGYGGYIDSFLSHPMLQPISRLTYCLYLVHLQIIIMIFHSMARPTYFDHTALFMQLMGIFALSIVGALILNLLSESPTVRLEKILLKR